MEMAEDAYPWATAMCLASTETAPARLLESLMANPACASFGPVHHYLVGAAILTCLRNAQGGAARELLPADLAELRARSGNVPGATCARWGACGAALSAGMAYAIAAGNAPLRREGWQEGQLMVSDMLRSIVEVGAPRCCKRDSRIVVAMAAESFSHAFGVMLPAIETMEPCAVSSQNTVCLGVDCPYYGADAAEG